MKHMKADPNESKRKKRRWITAILVLLAAAGFFVSVIFMYEKPADRFMENTSVNETDISGMTVQEARNALTDKWNSHSFEFICSDGVYKIPLDGAEISYDIEQPLTAIKDGRSYIDKLRYLFRIGNEYTVSMTSEGSETFVSQIGELPVCDNSERIKTKDAYVDLSDFAFRIVSEEIGTEVDPAEIEKAALSSISEGVFSAEIDESSVVKQPDVTSDSQELKDKQRYYRKYYSFELQYTVGGDVFKITPEQLVKMVDISEEGKAKVNDKAVQAFAQKLANKYNEYKKEYNFRTSGGNKRKVTAVSFGQVVDKNAEAEYLKSALKKQKSDDHEVVFSQKKFQNSDINDGIGNSYIEISIGDQHVWCYRDGELVVSCDCVTGIPGHDTYRGVFTIQWIFGPMTLKGSNDDGSKYESKVNCFMPFYGDQGLHGSNGWRSRWGGNIYKYNGSHGCVNCPDAAARQMADTVSVGYPVVIY